MERYTCILITLLFFKISYFWVKKLLPGCDLGKIYTEELTYLSVFCPDIM